jgi:glycosyltransferase involved in cell wall biosynthesis
MLHAIVTYLQSEHECTVMIPDLKEAYEYAGVKVIPRMSSMIRDADVVFCQLDTTNEAIKLGKCVVWVQHNTFPYPSVENSEIGVIYNGEASKQAMGWNNQGYVLPPPVDVDYYSRERSNPEYITLINCNENKGGKIFHELAKMMPERKFLAVLGSYGTQYVSSDEDCIPFNLDNKALVKGLGSLPNVTVVANSRNILRIYKHTRILLMPSLYESWGRVATEAMCSGIPVIATPTFGLKENCGNNGIFVQRDNLLGWMAAIKKLDGKKEYDEASIHARKRAMELHSGKKLGGLNIWLKKFVANHKKKKEYGI